MCDNFTQQNTDQIKKVSEKNKSYKLLQGK